MSLKIIYGRAGSGKSHRCLEEIRSRLESGNGSKLILIVPEQYSLQAEIKLVRSLGASGLNQAEVLSFRRMAYRTFSHVGGLTKGHIQAAGKCMLLYKIIDEMRDQLKIFSRAANQKGFVNTLSTTISELKRYNITSDKLTDLLVNQGENQAVLNQSLQNKLQDIGLIYSEYEKRLHENYMESDDDLTLLAEKLDSCDLFDHAEIWIDGFSGFTPQEYRVIEKLLKKAHRVNVTLCTDCLIDDCDLEGTALFSPTQAAAAKLVKIARNQGVTIETGISTAADSITISRFSGADVKHLEKHLYSYAAPVYREHAENIKVFAAANPYSEIEYVAREITKLCRDKGLRYSQMAVVTGDLNACEKMVEEIFKSYEIPCFIDRKKSINGHPLVLLVLSALQIFISHWSYASVFRYLKTGLTNLDAEAIDRIENYVLANGIRGTGWTRDEEWLIRLEHDYQDQPPTPYQIEQGIKINETKKRIVAPLVKFFHFARGKKTTKALCSALYELLCDIGVPERIENLVNGFKENGALNLANEYGQIWNILMAVLDQAVEVMGDVPLSIEKLYEILTVGFGEYNIGLIPPALEQVLVGSTERSKSHDIKFVFIIGANDGIFPAYSKDEGILSDQDREGLKACGLEIAQDTRSRAFEQQYLVYSTLTSASEGIYLSYPIADNEGRALRPSMIVARLKRLFPKLQIHSDLEAQLHRATGSFEPQVFEGIDAPLPTFNQMTAALKRQAEGYEEDGMWHETLRWYSRQPGWREKCSKLLEGFSYTNQVKPISPEKTKRLYGSQVYTSISRMEKFAACPFSYYVQYGLKAKERRIFQLSAPDLGAFLHQVLDAFSKSVQDSGKGWKVLEREWCNQEVYHIVDQLLEGMQGNILNSSRRYAYIAGRLKRILSRAVWLIALHVKRSQFEPMGHELGFGKGEELPPILLKLPSGGEIVLNGRIDRIDSMQGEQGTYLRIIDYKSGSKDFRLQDVYYGLQIQLITYLDALVGNKDVFGNTEIKGPVLPGGMLYFKIDDPFISGEKQMTEEQIEREIMKKLKMKGLLLADARLVKEMDNEIDGDSLIIPARINKDGGLGRSSAATLEQFELLRGHVRKLLGQLGEEMLKGTIGISPYKNKKNTPCQYCSYLSICQFDTAFKDNAYRVLAEKKDEVVWASLAEGGEV